jgi:hypothetical protein
MTRVSPAPTFSKDEEEHKGKPLKLESLFFKAGYLYDHIFLMTKQVKCYNLQDGVSEVQ